MLHGGALVAAQGLVGPLVPGLLAEMDLGSLVQGELPDPGVPVRKLPHHLGLVAAEAGEGGAQHPLPALIQGAVVHGTLRYPEPVQVLPGQQSLRRQGLRVQQQRVAGEGGHTGVGGVPSPGGAHRQNLPPALAGGLQKVCECPGLLAQGADAVGPRQGEHGQQNARGTLHFQSLKPLSSCGRK